ncbi:MAG: MBL fold metallo-hydrolase [Undibacterium sp.]|nr:MBL fold metallo-hydrolase [Opitutaceae bacterium]
MSTPPRPHSTRRHFLGATTAALVAATFPRSLGAAESAPKPALAPNSFSYRFAIGDIEAYSISDGSMLLREGLALMWPEAARPAMKADLVTRGERTDALPLYVNILVLKLGNEIAIFDGGFGPGKNPNSGWVGRALAEIGIAPEKVTHAFLSHAHSDHIGGFVAGNRAIFPNAAVHCLREEIDFWRSPEPDFSHSKRAKGPLPGMIKDAREKFDVLQPNLQFVRDGDSLLGGAITVIAAPGHTAGHAVFRIKSGNESLLHFMDVAHHHSLMFTDPNWGIAYDHVPEQAIDTRKKLFAQLANTHERTYGFHLPWPALGRIAAHGSGYSWQGERWSWGL